MRENVKLWFSFALRASAISLLTLLVPFIVGMIRLRRDFVPGPHPPMVWISLSLLMMAAIITTTVLSLLVSRRFLLPVDRLSAALEEVASGNFSISLPEDHPDARIRRINHNFNKMVRELGSTQVLQSDFVQNVSHEIKTPLAAMEGYAVLLNGAELPEELHSYAHKIIEGARQLSGLTGNILKLSRLERQEILPEPTTFSLDEQLREAFLSLEPLWSKKELELDLDLPSVSYCGSADLLLQVWTNLFANAVKFTPAGGTVGASIDEEPGWVTVTIRDTGCGMSPEVQKHMFDKFYQGEQSRHIEGNGLGLALVKRIVDLSGGTIHVKSAPGSGSAFYIELPVRQRS